MLSGLFDPMMMSVEESFGAWKGGASSPSHLRILGLLTRCHGGVRTWLEPLDPFSVLVSDTAWPEYGDISKLSQRE